MLILLATFLIHHSYTIAAAALNVGNVHLLRSMVRTPAWADTHREAGSMFELALDYRPEYERALLSYGRWYLLAGDIYAAEDLLGQAAEQ